MKFEISKEYKYFLIPLFMTVITIVCVPPYPRTTLYVLPFAGIWCWFLFLTSAYKIEINDQDELIAWSIFKKSKIRASDITWVRETIGFLTVNHLQGTIRIPTIIKNIKGIERSLKTLNPEIETKYRTYRGGEYKSGS